MLHLRYGGDAPARTCSLWRRRRARRLRAPRRHRRGRRRRAPSWPSHRAPAAGRRPRAGRGASLERAPGRPAAAVGARRAARRRARWPTSLGFTPRARAVADAPVAVRPAAGAAAGPTGVDVRTFVPGPDERRGWRSTPRVRRPPRAGRLDADDLHVRMREPWFDPSGFFLAERGRRRLVGFHWTKVHGADAHQHGHVHEHAGAQAAGPDDGTPTSARSATARPPRARADRRGLRRRRRPGAARPRARPRPHAGRPAAPAGARAARRDALRRRRQHRGDRPLHEPRVHPLGRRRGVQLVGTRLDGGVRRSPVWQGWGHDGAGVLADVTGPCPAPPTTPTAPGTEASVGEPLPEDRFLDRELSWLAFNERVLELAEDPDLPLLERASSSRSSPATWTSSSWSGSPDSSAASPPGSPYAPRAALMPREVLEGIWDAARELMRRHAARLPRRDPAGAAKRGHRAAALGRARRRRAGPARPGSSGTGSSRCSRRWPSTRRTRSPTSPGCRSTSPSWCATRRPAPSTSRGSRCRRSCRAWFALGRDQRFVPLEDVIAAHLDELFPGMEVLEHHAFRVTRNEDLEVEEDDAENLLQALETELMRRRFGPPVRLEVEETIDPHVLDLLVRELGVEHGGGRLASPARSTSPACSALADLPRPSSKLPAVPAAHGTRARRRGDRDDADMFAAHARPRRPAAPPVRLVLDERAGASSSRPPTTRTSSRSSRRSTAPAATRRSSTR